MEVQAPNASSHRRRVPALAGHTYGERNDHYNGTMPERKQRAAVAPETATVTCVVARQPVDRREVVSIEAVLESEQKHKRTQRSPFGRQFVHEHSPRDV